MISPLLTTCTATFASLGRFLSLTDFHFPGGISRLRVARPSAAAEESQSREKKIVNGTVIRIGLISGLVSHALFGVKEIQSQECIYRQSAA